ncbi:MAG: lytic transglycosylase domain-containing protein, partial [Caulobacteraceae bacterium]
MALLAPCTAVLASPIVLSQPDAGRYAAAFASAERGDAAAAEAAIAQVADPCLVGSVRYLVLAGPAAGPSTYDALSTWLQAYSALPGADRIYFLAVRVKPPGARLTAPAEPLIAMPPAPGPASRLSPAARKSFFSGDVVHALSLARSEGDRWIAGLAAWRERQFADAMDDFAALARDPAAGDAARAAGDFWAARAARETGQAEQARDFLHAAASAPDTFYGMIARRRLDLADDPIG